MNMEKFTVHQGVAAPILQMNIDTDAIIPSREMKLVSKQGLGDGLFAGWRYREGRHNDPNPDFVLNKPDYANTSMLIGGSNFGCGSSREHAVWALKEYGIRAIIAPSFGSIFYNNCTRNGILPVILTEAEVEALAEQVAVEPQLHQLAIDLIAQAVTAPNSEVFNFDISDGSKHMLLEGLDPISMTLQLSETIDAFQQRRNLSRPWLSTPCKR